MTLPRVHLLLVVALLLWPRPAAADRLDDIRARGRLVVAVSDTSPPFSARAPDGTGAVGYDVDLAAAVARRLDVVMEQRAIANAERAPALQRDEVDLVASSITRAKSRERDIDFSFAYFVSPHKVLVRKASGLVAVNQLAGRKLALVRSASVDAALKAAVPRLEILFVEDYAAAFDALAQDRADGFLADELLLLAFAQRSGAPEDFALLPDYELPRTAGFGIKKNEPRFKDFVNATLLELEASGEATKIFDRWFAPAKRSFHIQPD